MKKEIFEQYVVDFGSKLSRLCFSLCRNEHDASDLYQETWLKAYNSFDKTDVHNFEKWLYSICVNIFKDNYRKKIRGPQEMIFDSNEHKDAFMATLTDEHEYEIRDYSNLYAAIDKLPEKLKICISLKYFSNLSCAEISSILEISVSAVTTRLSRAIKVLAKEMNKGE
jgi:RNA polymerase sigma-70 factor (ECF subfamily)